MASAFSRLTTSAGVPAGAMKQVQAKISSPGSPSSAIVGTAGNSFSLLGPKTARGELPLMMYGCDSAMNPSTICTCLLAASTSAGAGPL